MQLAAGSLRICVDFFDRDSNCLEGRICGIAVEKEEPYITGLDLLIVIDEVLNRIGQPQATRRMRSFKKQDAAQQQKEGYCANPQIYHKTEEVKNSRGTIGTFDAHFTSRHHSTWQGMIAYVDRAGNEENLSEFRSEIELSRYMIRALKNNRN